MRTRRSKSSSDPVSEPHAARAERGEHHTAVLLHEAVDALALKSTSTVVDATLGGAGHARGIVEILGADGLFIGFDMDSDAVERANDALAHARPKIELINANFRHMKSELEKRGINYIDAALFDLGWSAYQLDAGRGFSFSRKEGQEDLLMTYAKTVTPQTLTAATIVNEWSEESIADILFGWGDERYSRRIAQAIVEQRAHKPFATAGELAETIYQAVPSSYAHGRLHPATKSFQALRIAVNDELGALTAGLESARTMLRHGRIAVITFHSTEDRVVKRIFAEWEKNGWGIRITKKPLTSSESEVKENPRARSAKLRVFEIKKS